MKKNIENSIKLNGNVVKIQRNIEEEITKESALKQVKIFEERLENIKNKISSLTRQKSTANLQFKTMRVQNKEIDKLRKVQQALEKIKEIEALDTQLNNFQTELKNLAKLTNDMRGALNGNSE